MKRLFTVTLSLLLVIFQNCKTGNTSPKARTEAKGGVFFGGTLRVNETEKIKNFLPITINELHMYHLASQVYEGLVKYNPFDLNIEPALSYRWEISDDKKEYTFHLRKEVRFHNDSCFANAEGRELNAADVKYCFEKLCSRHPFNKQFDVTFKDRVEGASEFYTEGGASGLSGLTVVDDSTIKIKLVQPDANFLNVLAMPGCYIYPKEAAVKYGQGVMQKAVGTGPFYIPQIHPEKNLILERNPFYWGYDKHGNQLPYLDSVVCSFINNKNGEMFAFNANTLDMVYGVTSSLLGNTLAQTNGKLNFEIFSSPALTTEYYCFNVQVNPFFSIKEIRTAFNLAIDRQKLIETALKGEGRVADKGLIPYTEVFEKNGYNYKAIKNYPYKPDSAKKLLAQAGYMDGKGLPDFNLEINDGGGERNMRVATEVQRMLKENIGVKMNINIVSFEQHLENIQKGKSDFFRYAWVSDYPDPESFLTLFYGKFVPENFEDPSYINLGHFKNASFDSTYVQARTELDKKKRYGLYSQANRILMEESALIPLFYDENQRVVKKNVKNLTENPLSYMDFSVVFKVPEQTAVTAAKK